jgi:hypothetical protein
MTVGPRGRSRAHYRKWFINQDLVEVTFVHRSYTDIAQFNWMFARSRLIAHTSAITSALLDLSHKQAASSSYGGVRGAWFMASGVLQIKFPYPTARRRMCPPPLKSFYWLHHCCGFDSFLSTSAPLLSAGTSRLLLIYCFRTVEARFIACSRSSHRPSPTTACSFNLVTWQRNL